MPQILNFSAILIALDAEWRMPLEEHGPPPATMRDSTFGAMNSATIRFLIVLRPTAKDPFLFIASRNA